MKPLLIGLGSAALGVLVYRWGKHEGDHHDHMTNIYVTSSCHGRCKD